MVQYRLHHHRVVLLCLAMLCLYNEAIQQKRTSQAGLHAIHVQDFGGINTQRQQALCFGPGQKPSKSTAASQVLMTAPSKGTMR